MFHREKNPRLKSACELFSALATEVGRLVSRWWRDDRQRDSNIVRGSGKASVVQTEEYAIIWRGCIQHALWSRIQKSWGAHCKSFITSATWEKEVKNYKCVSCSSILELSRKLWAASSWRWREYTGTAPDPIPISLLKNFDGFILYSSSFFLKERNCYEVSVVAWEILPSRKLKSWLYIFPIHF